MIPCEGWNPMDSAPRAGDIVIVKFHEFNDPKKPEQVAYAQWGCDQWGNTWAWRAPFRMGTLQYADGWMLYQDFILAAQRPEKKPELEFDL